MRHRTVGMVVLAAAVAPGFAWPVTELAARPDLVLEGSVADAQLGALVAPAGDVDGDGYADVLVSGRAELHLYRGSAAGLEAAPAWSLQVPVEHVRGYVPAAGAGDVNGDGFDDVIVGRPGATRAELYPGSASGLAPAPIELWPDHVWCDFGGSVAGAGDVNGDGYADLLVGEPCAPDYGVEGRVWIYLGTPSGPLPLREQLSDGYLHPQYGTSVSGAGDLNGDGFGDYLLWDPSGQHGAVHVRFGFPGELWWTVPDPVGFLQIKGVERVDLAGGGDLDGDGLDDLAFGSCEDETVFVFFGKESRDQGLRSFAPVRVPGAATDPAHGLQVSITGDVNGDGFSDLLVGASAEGGDAGRAMLHLGSGGGAGAASAWVRDGVAGEALGASVAVVGDVNGDGYDDVVLGAPLFSKGNLAARGRALVFYGACTDDDLDGHCAQQDVCPGVADPGQADSDGDGLGDACDPCPGDVVNDADLDGLCAVVDNCPEAANADQADRDGDGIGDACDACPDEAPNDGDRDGVCAPQDTCPLVTNPDQRDADGDGLGDACDPCPADPGDDADGDGLCADVDVCPSVADPGQADGDHDGVGDACDLCPDDPGNDVDGDGICALFDRCPDDADPDQADSDFDGIGDACDRCTFDATNDGDGDTVCENVDNCPGVANWAQADSDGDGAGNLCDPCPLDPEDDADGDGVCGDVDVCPAVADPDQHDGDGDGVGDACDPAPPADEEDPEAPSCGCTGAAGGPGASGLLVLLLLGLPLTATRRRR